MSIKLKAPTDLVLLKLGDGITKMTLIKAINHELEKAKSCKTQSQKEHYQLALWLQELQARRDAMNPTT